MERIPVSSSMIASIGYEPSQLLLEVEFLKGGIYQYLDVPQAVVNELMATAQSGASVGTYFRAHVRDAYRHVKL